VLFPVCSVKTDAMFNTLTPYCIVLCKGRDILASTRAVRRVWVGWWGGLGGLYGGSAADVY